MTPQPPRRHPLAAGVWSGSAPLVLWALHFTACYVAAAVGCIAPGDEAAVPGRVTVFVAGVTAVALAVVSWMVVRTCLAVRRQPGDLLPRLRLLVAALSAVGIAWTGLPLAFLSPCG
jgi:hypothetical protein